MELEIHSFPLNHSIPTCGFLFLEKPHPRKIRKSVLKEYDIPDYAFEGIKQGNDFVTTTGELIPNETLTIPGIVHKDQLVMANRAIELKDDYTKQVLEYLRHLTRNG